MLKEICVSNFKSIHSEITFSMEADLERVSEYPDHIIHIGDSSLLKVTSMYGPNGGGKTNLLSALALAKALFVNGENSLIIPQQLSNVFHENQIIEETLFFVTKDYEIGYHFKMLPEVIQRNNINPMLGITQNVNYMIYHILEEDVSYRKTNETDFISLFSRNELGEVNSQAFDELRILENVNLSKNKSVINYVYNTFANNNSELQECLHVIKCLALELLSIQDLTVHNISNNEKILSIIKINRKKLIQLLNHVDIKIKDIKLYNSNHYYPIFFVRELETENNKIEKEISLSEESAGTQKIFWMFVNILSSIAHQNIFLCDDMNALLHPKLFRSIVELFTSKENQTSQLIFNSHDILNMDSNLFRRDEIWFIYRDENYSTQAVPLSNIVNYKGEQVRKDAKYSKQYLEGKYGADPFIKKGLFWDD